jgi:hypothetical protein
MGEQASSLGDWPPVPLDPPTLGRGAFSCLLTWTCQTCDHVRDMGECAELVEPSSGR